MKQSYSCHWTDQLIAIDGKLRAPAWKRAPVLTDFFLAGTRKRATTATAARLLWSETHLYFLAEMEDTDLYERVSKLALPWWRERPACDFCGNPNDHKRDARATMQFQNTLYGSNEGHDPPFGGDDLIELFVKPGRSQPTYWEFHVSPRGATRDYFYARRHAGGDERWIAYNSGMKAQSRSTAR